MVSNFVRRQILWSGLVFVWTSTQMCCYKKHVDFFIKKPRRFLRIWIFRTMANYFLNPRRSHVELFRLWLIDFLTVKTFTIGSFQTMANGFSYTPDTHGNHSVASTTNMIKWFVSTKMHCMFAHPWQWPIEAFSCDVVQCWDGFVVSRSFLLKIEIFKFIILSI